ncbi:MAG: NAD(P)-dependent oxidoreductase [Bdellovibrionota bacterium]
MKIVVFGGSGFLGSHVADELTRLGHEVTIFDKTESLYANEKQAMVVGDIMDADAVYLAMKGQDIAYNFAGLADLNASIARPKETFELNVIGNINILEAAAKAKLKRYVYASTVYVFSKKGSFYGISKSASERVIEEYAEQKKLPFTIVRYGSVYGPRADKSNRIYRILRQALEEGKITFQGNGEEEREYIHVRDAARLSAEVLKDEFVGQHIMLTGTERYKYSDLLKIINEIMEGRIQIVYLNEDYRGHYVMTPYSFSPKASHKLVANPFTDFGQGLLETVETIYQDLEVQEKETTKKKQKKSGS